MKLYFENSYGKRRVIAEPKNEEEAWKEIHKFCKDRNFEIYYIRTWNTPDGAKVYDVGSWSESFILSN